MGRPAPAPVAVRDRPPCCGGRLIVERPAGYCSAMTTTSGLLVDVDVPAAPPLSPGRPAGFLDCRGEWHSWTDGEED